MFDRRLIKSIDFVLLVIICMIFAMGVIMIISATNNIDLSQDMSLKEGIVSVIENGIKRQPKLQIIAFILGLVAMGVMMSIDYNTMGEMYKIIYGLSIFVLLLVYVPGLGVKIGGARSWIKLGIINIQTSELAKLGFIVALAKYIDNKGEDFEFLSIRDIISPLLFAAPFILMVYKQPDLGSALVFVIITLSMIFVSGLNWKIILYGGVAGACSLPIVYKLLAPHQRVRIDAFLDPNHPNNYQVRNSMTAIGSGMTTGKGLFKGTFHRGDFLPVQETDFIFAVLGEELGLIGCTIVLALYFLFLMRMLYISKNTKDNYGRLIVVGVTFMFAYQIIENIGMTIGVMPVTGVTLPFMSYGGSSILTSMMAIGLVLNVAMRNKKIRF